MPEVVAASEERCLSRIFSTHTVHLLKVVRPFFKGRAATMNQVSHPHTPVPFFDEAEVQRVLHLEALIPAMEQALIDFSAGRVVHPVRSVVSVSQHGGFMGLMPAVYGDIMGTKLVNLYPGNAARGLPTHLAIIVLFRVGDGRTPGGNGWPFDHGIAHRSSIGGGNPVTIPAQRLQARNPRQWRAGTCPRQGAWAGAKVRQRFAFGVATRNMQSCWLTRLVAPPRQQKKRCATPILLSP